MRQANHDISPVCVKLGVNEIHIGSLPGNTPKHDPLEILEVC